jgi:hypothetical protein
MKQKFNRFTFTVEGYDRKLELTVDSECLSDVVENLQEFLKGSGFAEKSISEYFCIPIDDSANSDE